MKRKRFCGAAQNAALVLLTASALFLLTQLPLLQNIRLSPRAIFAPNSSTEVPEESPTPAAMFPPVNLMVTRDSEHGRCGQLCLSAGADGLQSILPLFQEALGSATQVGQAQDSNFRAALKHPGFYLELMSEPLPLEAVAAWLGAEADYAQPVQAMALVAGYDGGAALFLLDGEGEATLYSTALPVSAVRSLCEEFLANDSYFAFETGYNTLSPYAVLTADAGSLPYLQGERPVGYSAYNLLTALDFNAHTISRYRESGGAEVVEESPRTLRIGPDGVVTFISRGAVNSNIYRASGEELPDILAAAWRLATALTDGTGASPMFLQKVEELEDGCILHFRYQWNGVPVYLSDGNDALAVTFQKGAVTGFTYRCRTYTPLEEEPLALLPTKVAQAVAAAYPDAALSIGYVDDGSERLSAQWRR